MKKDPNQKKNYNVIYKINLISFCIYRKNR